MNFSGFYISNKFGHNTSVPNGFQVKEKVKKQPATLQGCYYYVGYVVLHFHFQFLEPQMYIFFRFNPYPGKYLCECK